MPRTLPYFREASLGRRFLFYQLLKNNVLKMGRVITWYFSRYVACLPAIVLCRAEHSDHESYWELTSMHTGGARVNRVLGLSAALVRMG